MKSKVLEKVKTELLPKHDWLNNYIRNYERTLLELERFCLPARKGMLNVYRRRYEQLFQLLAIDCEPATPPEGWYVGVLRYLGYGWCSREAGESLQRANLILPDKNYPGHYGIKEFIGYTPPEVYKKYKKASRIVPPERLVVVSPDPSLFQTPLVSSDPMLFAFVGIDDIDWLRVCSWDIREDLKEILEKGEVKPVS